MSVSLFCRTKRTWLVTILTIHPKGIVRMNKETGLDEDEVLSTSSLRQEIKKYVGADAKLATWQLLNTLIPYFALWGVMRVIIHSHASLWLLAPCILVAGGLLIRVFIFFHDCCHGSFFRTKEVNRFWGYVCGTLTYTDFESWKDEHNEHHQTSSDLDRRGVGDITTLTVQEYLGKSPGEQFRYRLYRSPFILFLIGPPIKFLLINRFVRKEQRAYRASIMRTDIYVGAVTLCGAILMGLWTYLLLQIAIMSVASCVGVWLFYVQHQFEEDYWEHHENWTAEKAALEGSSFYKLPKLLQWFTGNIGFHHIHHYRPGVPNFNLEKCYEAIPELKHAKVITLFQSFSCIRLKLWDEETRTMVGFRAAHRNFTGHR
jgi:omega-6 fatty acid desaturase (delta-12 desaturase)